MTKGLLDNALSFADSALGDSALELKAIDIVLQQDSNSDSKYHSKRHKWNHTP
jgi:hypothetical protein